MIVKKVFKRTAGILLFSVLVLQQLHTTAQGIAFQDASWKEILKKASAENKLVFLDAYTAWCGPCKIMSRQVFTDSLVGQFFNQNFINAKIDMEKGEGPGIASQYGIQAYPTLLFINGSGQMVHRAVGYHNVNQFLELGRKAGNPTERLEKMENRFQSGDRDPDFLYQYALLRLDLQDAGLFQVAEAYLQTQQQLDSEKNLDFIYKTTLLPEGLGYDLLIKYKDRYSKSIGVEKVNERIHQLLYNHLLEKASNYSESNAYPYFRKVYEEDEARRRASYYRLTWHRSRGEGKAFAKSAIDHYKRFQPVNAEELGEVAYTFSVIVDKKKWLKKGLEWGLKSVELQEDHHNHEAVAYLYNRLGNKSNALKHANMAKNIAVAKGLNTTEIDTFINSLNK